MIDRGREAVEIIQGAMSAGETLLWAGKPTSGFRFLPYDWFVVPIVLFWMGIPIFIVGTTPPSQSGGPPAWFFVPFLMIGSFLLVGRYAVDAWVRSRTYYGITDHSVVIVQRAFRENTQFLDLRSLNAMTLTLRRDGTGVILFGTPLPMMYGNIWLTGGQWGSPRFDWLADARGVYEQIRSARQALAVGRS